MSAEALIKSLTALAIPQHEDRAALARLRRALEPSGAVQAYRYIHEALEGANDLESYTVIAATFGHNPRHEYGYDYSIGSVCAKLADKESEDAAERRFNAMLSAERDRLAIDIIGVAKRAQRRELPIDYARLLSDIQAWDDPTRKVQLSWARDFYRNRQAVKRASRDDTSK